MRKRRATGRKRPRKSGGIPSWVFVVVAVLSLAGAGIIGWSIFHPKKEKTQPAQTVPKSGGDFLSKIDGAIEQFRIDMGVPKKYVYVRKKEEIPRFPGEKIREVTIRVSKNFPPAFVNYMFQRAIKDSGGTIIDCVEKSSGGKFLIDIGYGEVLTHRVRIIRSSNVQIEPGYVALLIDDFGYYPVKTAKKFFDLGIKFTAAVLPNGKYTSYILNELDNYPDIERFVHIPMEPKGYPQADPGPNAIMVSYDDRKIRELVERHLSAVPGAVGANNHMGSRATENTRVMYQVLRTIRDAGFFFVDSRTTPYSVAEDIARKIGVPATHIDHIIDPPGISPAEIESRLYEYCLQARRVPAMIINCHASDTTAKILEKNVPILKRYGIEFVPVSMAFERKLKWQRAKRKGG